MRTANPVELEISKGPQVRNPIIRPAEDALTRQRKSTVPTDKTNHSSTDGTQARRRGLFPALNRVLNRGRVVACALIVLLLGVVNAVRAQDWGDQNRLRKKAVFVRGRGHLVTPRARRAIARGLSYLARRQNEDGSWSDGIGRKVNQQYLNHYGKHVGVTSLACMAFMSSGSLPERGPYGEEVAAGLDWVVAKVKRDGFVAHNGSRMYSHAFATLFLAEVYGMTPTPRVKKALKKATKLIEDAQNDQGGWRYLPGAKDSDISITVCQVQALRAARNAGIMVQKGVIDKAVAYVKKSYIARGSYKNRYGFWYQVFENEPFRPSRTSFALTSAGVTALYGAGEYDLREIRGGLTYLKNPNNRPRPDDMHRTFDYFYGHYYAMQAFFQAGDDYWNDWYPSVRDEIVAGQHGDGRWEDLVGPNYATAMACVVLQVPYQYLPIFER